MVTTRGVLWSVGVLALSVPLAAQHEGIRQSFAGAADPIGPASEWALASAGVAVPLAVALEAHGPATRLTPATDLTLFRPQWTVAGTFAVSALFEVLPEASATAAYGLIVGGTEAQPLALALLIRPDGTIAIQRSVSARSWTPLATARPLRRRGALDPDAAPAPLDRLEVRVGATTATCLVNGRAVAVVPIAPGELDGYAGVHAAAGSAVQVSGFTLEGAVTVVAR